MKLVPIAKPVKIRIISGGREHSTLDSLSRCFVWSDILDLLKEGSLVKWLNGKGYADKASRLQQIPNAELSPISVYNILFDGSVIGMEEDVFVSLRFSDEYKSLADSLLDLKSTDELLSLNDRHRDLKPFIAYRLAEKVRRFSKEMPAETWFNVGKFLYPIELHKRIGEECIRCAAKKGYKDAMDFSEKYMVKEKTKLSNLGQRDEILGLLKYEKVKQTIRDSWKHNINIPFSNKLSLNCLYGFSNVCLEMNRSSMKPQLVAESYLDILNSGDPLYQEKKFVLAMVTTSKEKAMDILNGIPNYPPAKIILNSTERTRSPYCACEGIRFTLGATNSNASVLQYYLLNLEKFARLE